MRKLALLTLATLSLPAMAESPIDKYMGSADGVAIDGVVEVPLFTTPDGLNVPCVKVTIGEKDYLFAIATDSSAIYVGDRVIADAGLETKDVNKKLINLKGKSNKWKTGGKLVITEIESLKIGGLELTDLTVLAEDPSDTKHELEAQSQWGLDGFIGMGALPSLSYAVLPSKGVMTFAPADQGAALLTAVGGTPVSYETIDSELVRYGKRKDKAIRPVVNLVIPAKIGGQDVKAAIALNSVGGLVSSDVTLPDAPTMSMGDAYWSHQASSAAGADLDTSWYYRFSFGPYVNLQNQAWLGTRALEGMDIAVDTANQQVSMKAATANKRQNPLAWLVEDALATAKKAPEAVEGEEAPEVEAGMPPGDAAKWARVAELSAHMGSYDDAVTARKNAAKHDEDTCGVWLELGRTELAAGAVDDAIASLTKSSDMYHAWWDQDLDTRTEVAEAKAKFEKKNEGEDYVDEAGNKVLTQADSCHTADGHLASALLAKGEVAAVHDLYNDRMDLDRGLAVAWGVGAVASGQTSDAHAPLRQSITRERAADSRSRMALAVAYDDASDWATAKGHYERVLSRPMFTPLSAASYLDAVARNEGNDAAVKAADKLALSRPDLPAAQLANTVTAWRYGAEMDHKRAAKRAKLLLNDLLEKHPENAQLKASYAQLLLTTGELEAAADHAQAAVKLDGSNANARLAMAQVLTAQGAEKRAENALKSLKAAAPLHIEYLTYGAEQLEAYKPAPPEPEPAPEGEEGESAEEGK